MFHSCQIACINDQLYWFKSLKHSDGIRYSFAVCSGQCCYQSCFGKSSSGAECGTWEQTPSCKRCFGSCPTGDGFNKNLHWSKQMRCWRSRRLKTLEEEKKFHTEVIKNQSKAIADMATRMPSTAKAANVPETASEPGPSEVNAMPEERYDMDDQILQDDDCKDLMQKITEMKKIKESTLPIQLQCCWYIVEKWSTSCHSEIERQLASDRLDGAIQLVQGSDQETQCKNVAYSNWCCRWPESKRRTRFGVKKTS